MSEQIFEELQNDGVDIASIFGGGVQSSETNPFSEAPASQPVVDAVPPEPEPVQSAPTPLPSAATAQPAPAQEPAQPPVTAPVPETPAVPVTNPLQAALEEKEAQIQQTAVQSLFERVPVFACGSDKDPITDPAMTFEELRIAKTPDYPDCLIKPRVTAQSKGIAAYKGVFHSVEDAQASGKTICLIPAADGKVYEMRKTEMGEFIAPKDNIVEFQAVRAEFSPALPLIPQTLLQQIISFFRCYTEEDQEFEALAHILWDRELEEFTVYIPPQQVSKARVEASLPLGRFSAERYLRYPASKSSISEVHYKKCKAAGDLPQPLFDVLLFSDFS